MATRRWRPAATAPHPAPAVQPPAGRTSRCRLRRPSATPPCRPADCRRSTAGWQPPCRSHFHPPACIGPAGAAIARRTAQAWLQARTLQPSWRHRGRADGSGDGLDQLWPLFQDGHAGLGVGRRVILATLAGEVHLGHLLSIVACITAICASVGVSLPGPGQPRDSDRAGAGTEMEPLRHRPIPAPSGSAHDDACQGSAGHLPGSCLARARPGQARRWLDQAVARVALLQDATATLDVQSRCNSEGEVDEAQLAIDLLDNEGPIRDVRVLRHPAVRPIHAQLVATAFGRE